jgi:hypothetical protein
VNFLAEIFSSSKILLGVWADRWAFDWERGDVGVESAFIPLGILNDLCGFHRRFGVDVVDVGVDGAVVGVDGDGTVLQCGTSELLLAVLTALVEVFESPSSEHTIAAMSTRVMEFLFLSHEGDELLIVSVLYRGEIRL